MTFAALQGAKMNASLKSDNESVKIPPEVLECCIIRLEARRINLQPISHVVYAGIHNTVEVLHKLFNPYPICVKRCAVVVMFPRDLEPMKVCFFGFPDGALRRFSEWEHLKTGKSIGCG